MKIMSSRNGNFALSFTDRGKSFSCRNFFTVANKFLTLSAEIKFSRKFPNVHLRYLHAG